MERGGEEHAVEITSFGVAAFEAMPLRRVLIGWYMVETAADKTVVLCEMLIRWQLLFVVQDMTSQY